MVSHPLPDSNIRELDQWLTGERWDVISETDSPYDKQVENFQSMINQQVKEIFLQRKVKKVLHLEVRLRKKHFKE